jgi:hypothetical protein
MESITLVICGSGFFTPAREWEWKKQIIWEWDRDWEREQIIFWEWIREWPFYCLYFESDLSTNTLGITHYKCAWQFNEYVSHKSQSELFHSKKLQRHKCCVVRQGTFVVADLSMHKFYMHRQDCIRMYIVRCTMYDVHVHSHVHCTPMVHETMEKCA